MLVWGYGLSATTYRQALEQRRLENSRRSGSSSFTASSVPTLDAMADALIDRLADELAMEYLIATGGLSQ
jgi:hypothetical protein